MPLSKWAISVCFLFGRGTIHRCDEGESPIRPGSGCFSLLQVVGARPSACTSCAVTTMMQSILRGSVDAPSHRGLASSTFGVGGRRFLEVKTNR